MDHWGYRSPGYLHHLPSHEDRQMTTKEKVDTIMTMVDMMFKIKAGVSFADIDADTVESLRARLAAIIE